MGDLVIDAGLRLRPGLVKSVSESWACRSAFEKCSPADANAHTLGEILTYGIVWFP